MRSIFNIKNFQLRNQNSAGPWQHVLDDFKWVSDFCDKIKDK